MDEQTVIIRQKFPPEKEKAAELLAHGANQRKVARHLGKHYQTIHNWCKDPEFKERIEELRTDIEGTAREIILNGLVDAATTVTGAASGDLSIDSKELAPRLKAALWILDFLKEKRLPASGAPKKRSFIAPSIDDEEAKDLLEV